MQNTLDISNAPGVGVNPIPLSSLLPWAAFASLLFLLAIYFVGAEQGAVSMFNGNGVHEFVHDARHSLGFPCH
jgi:hypothetical protein